MTNLLFFLLILCFFHSSSAGAKVVYNVAKFGAKPDGKTDSAGSFSQAWASACNSASPATVYVPAGKFLLSHAIFQGPCKNVIKFQIDGTIVAPSNNGGPGKSRWVVFDSVRGLSIYGGTLDGRGTALWACKAAHRSCPAGATSLVINKAKDVTINGLTSVNSKLYHIVIDRSEHVTLQGVRITAPGNSPNTDGVHVQHSKGVAITGTTIQTGDDCVSIGQGTSDLWIERVACGPGHGISIGSLGKEIAEDGVQNVTVKNVAFKWSQNGLRIKTWARPSKGFVRGVVFQHATMDNVQNPIIIDQNYCPHNIGCPNENSGVAVSQVTYRDVRGTSATPVAVKFDCSLSSPCSGIGLHDIKLTYGNQKALSSCSHARGTTSGLVVPPSCLQ